MLFPWRAPTTLPAARAVPWCGRQRWTGSHSLPAPKNPSPGALGLAAGVLAPPFSTRLSQGAGRRRMQCVVPTDSIPASERGALSVAPVNLNVYLGNNLTSPPSPLQGGPATGTRRMFFLLLIRRKIPGFLCSRMVSLSSVCVEPGCLGAPRALRSAHVLWDAGGASAGLQTSQTEPNPDLTGPVEFRARCPCCLYCVPCKSLGDRS